MTLAQCEERLGSEGCVWVPGDPPRPVTVTRLDIVSLQRLGEDVT